MVECNDKKCPIHGSVKVRGNIFEGTVVNAKAQHTATIQRILIKKVRKFERFKKLKSKITVHNPACINAKSGDKVKVGETRRLSKTKSFVIMEKLNN